MILDPESLRARERDRGAARGGDDAERRQARAARVRAGDRDAARAATRARPASSCAALRAQVCDAAAAAAACAIGSAGHAPVRAAGRTSASPAGERYRDLVDALRFVARQEIIFGLHVHVGIDDAEKAIHVANGMRVHVAAAARAVGQLAVLARRRPPASRRRGCRSSAPSRASASRPRTPAGPTSSGGSRFMTEAGVIEDYTWMWYDVRPHPNLGTVEIRAMDAQTRVEHTLGLAALVQAMARELAEGFDRRRAARAPDGARCSTPTAGWPPGTGSRVSSSTCRTRSRSRPRRSPGGMLERLEPHAQDLGVGGRAERRQRPDRARERAPIASGSSYEANGDFSEVVKEVGPKRPLRDA